jgi:3-oxoacyl-(acyl-carrier-protein) synthase
MALDDARCSNEMIDLLSANAASEPENDRGEADFIRRRYGEAPPPVTAIRSTVGQGLGASGGIQAVANVLSIDRGFIPPTLNYTDPDPACRVETLAVTLQRTPLRYVLQHTFGYLGIQSALVFGAYGTR